MTFSQSVKQEILKSVRNVKRCCATSFLTAVLKSVGSLSLGFRGFSFSMESDNPDFLELCKTLSATHLNVDARIGTYNVNVKGAPIYSCKFDGAIGDKLGLVSRDDGGLSLCEDVSALIPTELCCKRAFLQGLFVASGSVVIPVNDDITDTNEKARYHLELRFTDNTFAEAVRQSYPEINFRVTVRKNHTILYLKDSDSIADFFVLVNATSAKLKLENIVIVRSVRNKANRQLNCTVANIEKAVAAAAKQLDAIATLRHNGKFDVLPDNLKEIALLREKYPEATLDEIADMLHISKSGVNHRFARLIELAKK